MKFRSYVPAFFVLASFLLLLFINLSGVSNSLPRLWWSEVRNEQGLVRWFSYKICLVGPNDENYSCSDKAPATPYSPVDKYIGYQIPVEFLERRNFYYYGSRFSYAGFLLAVIFTGLALIFSILSMYKVYHIRNLILLFTVMGLISVISAATVQTTVHVTGTKVFNQYNIPAKVGTTMLALMWSSFVALVLAVLIIPRTTLGNVVSK